MRAATLAVCVLFSGPADAKARPTGALVWSGYLNFETCVHNKDVYAVGNYVFLCNKFTYDYPYHYGNVMVYTRNGRDAVACTADEQCSEGTLIRR